MGTATEMGTAHSAYTSITAVSRDIRMVIVSPLGCLLQEFESVVYDADVVVRCA